MLSHLLFLFPRNLLSLIVRKCFSKSLLGRSGFMCNVFQRLDCPLKDMEINALCVIARRWHPPNPPHVSLALKIHTRIPKSQISSDVVDSLLSLMHFNNTVILSPWCDKVNILRSNLELAFTHSVDSNDIKL